MVISNRKTSAMPLLEAFGGLGLFGASLAGSCEVKGWHVQTLLSWREANG